MGGNVININVVAKDMATSVFKGIGASAQALGSTIMSALKVGIVFMTTAVIGLGTAALNAGSNFEILETQMGTALGGSRKQVRKTLLALQDFAAKTPLQMEEIITAFISLKNRGLNPSQRALKSYGDTASSMGKGLQQMVEAVADATTGEFERLKEFGIRASSTKDKVAFTFKGVTTTVKKNSREIENYLIRLGEVNFAGGMEKQSRTLEGRWSTLMDTANAMFTKIAQKSGLMEAAKGVVEGFTKFLDDNSESILKVASATGQLISGLKDFLETGDATNDLLFEFSRTVGMSKEQFKQFSDGLAFVRDTLIGIGDYVMNTLVPVIQAHLKLAFDFLKPSIDELMKAFDQLMVELKPYEPMLKEFGAIAMEIAKGALQVLAVSIVVIIKLILDLIRIITQVVSHFLWLDTTVRKILTPMFDWIMEKIRPVIDAFHQLNKAAINWGSGLKMPDFKMPDFKLPGFANGGQFKVGGKGGVDQNLVMFKASKDETVSIDRPGQSSSKSQSVNITNNFQNTMVNEQQLASILAYQLKLLR